MGHVLGIYYGLCITAFLRDLIVYFNVIISFKGDT